MLNRLLNHLKIKPNKCDHSFNLADLKSTGIPEPEQPKTNDYIKLAAWFRTYWESDHVKKRVAWPCSKCGTVFYAHCGLDMLKHGEIVQPKEWSKNRG